MKIKNRFEKHLGGLISGIINKKEIIYSVMPSCFRQHLKESTIKANYVIFLSEQVQWNEEWGFCLE
ncbi:MAG: hypothetical protein ANIMEMIM_00021 [Candidatus Argoarchaeum ethanivorans]|uniref:Uncharacterized protein n=1 Tax=Candidatus Argoarchaeum ethanivorans TaxID=2608793 RepID=A0A811T876_9EURY|nr:MAG: hypothetical protein ANIMEMIM_00021 [Candidatus Argoarchaeum ethanivorans]CAD6493494.1 MAG: hypothetical protein EMLJLAPB_00527 [Candidatus Argoarchaeum ethanivorans]